MLKISRVVFGMIFVLVVSGCANKGYFPPTASDFQYAATKAVTHPGTWAPVVGASVVAIGGWDHDVSDWAQAEAPVFGSPRKAARASNTLRATARWSMIGSALIPYDSDKGYWVPMIERQIIQNLGAGATMAVRAPLIEVIGRERPNGREDGFPSGHATRTFATIASSYQNMEDTDLNPVVEGVFIGTQIGIGAATSWARVEAGYHYPTDVLAGAALGNVVSTFVNSLFLDDHSATNSGTELSVMTSVWPVQGIGLQVRF